MDTLSAIARRSAAGDDPMMVFDWDKAAKLILDAKPGHAGAGLRSDWEWTGGTIWEDGAPVKNTYLYLSSNWATPEIDIDGDVYECWKYEKDTSGWGAKTLWPESALKILGLKP